jgi:hypothetical protein
LNKEKGYFLSPAIAAGKKVVDSNGNNTFSGVMLGDLGHLGAAKDLIQETGLYGFHEGATSFAFMEDGTAYIGKSTSGRILFDGTKSIITSNKMAKREGGLELDFDDGKIRMVNPSDGTIKGTILVDAGAKTYPFTIGNKFKVNWDGSIRATDGIFSGTISGSDIYGGTISIGDNFNVDYNGNLTANNGSFTGIINGSKIYGSDIFFGAGKGYLYSVYHVATETYSDDILYYTDRGPSFEIEDSQGNKIIYTFKEIREANN